MKAKCFCGKVRYHLGSEPLHFINCHCGVCRALNGSAFTSWLCISSEEFVLEKGEAMIRTFAASDNITVHFCDECGTRLHSLDKRHEMLIAFPAGITDVSDKHQPSKDYFYSDRACWSNVFSDLPKFGGSSGIQEMTTG
ncbi:MAG: GFA family protein [Agarilytica sp.]